MSSVFFVPSPSLERQKPRRRRERGGGGRQKKTHLLSVGRHGQVWTEGRRLLDRGHDLPGRRVDDHGLGGEGRANEREPPVRRERHHARPLGDADLAERREGPPPVEDLDEILASHGDPNLVARGGPGGLVRAAAHGGDAEDRVALGPRRVEERDGVRAHAHRGHGPPVGAEPRSMDYRLAPVERAERLGQLGAERHDAEQPRAERVDDGDTVGGLRGEEDAVRRGGRYGYVEGVRGLAVEPEAALRRERGSGGGGGRGREGEGEQQGERGSGGGGDEGATPRLRRLGRHRRSFCKSKRTVFCFSRETWGRQRSTS